MGRLKFPAVALLLTLIGLGAFALVQVSGADAQQPTPDPVPGEIIIAFNSGVGEGAILTFNRQNGLTEKEDLTGISGGHRGRTKSVTFNGDVDRGLRTRLSRNPNVRYAEPNYILSIDVDPNDPFYGSLWGLKNIGRSGVTPDADIDGSEAWDHTAGSSSIIVGIIDTGINNNHPDLTANIWTNLNEIPANNFDDARNGYIDDIHGINAIDNSGDPLDDQSHGSHTAGTIGAAGNNGIGVVGVNWDVSIIGCKFLNAHGSGSLSDAMECFKYSNHLKHVQRVNIQVTNDSWGGSGFSQAMSDTMEGLDQPGMSLILHATAADNGDFFGNPMNNDATPHYPSSYALDNNIAVAATDRKEPYASFSNY